MARVTVYISSVGSGGGERVGVFVAGALAAAGYEVDLAVATFAGVLAGDPVVQAHGVNLGGGEFNVRNLLRHVRERKPDLLIAIGRSAKIVAGIVHQIEPTLRWVPSIHGVLSRPRLQRFWLRMLFGYAPERWLYRRAIAFHAISPQVAAQVVRNFAVSADRVRVIANPVTLERTTATAPDIPGLDLSRPFIVTAGRLAPEKAQHRLITAFAQSGLAGRVQLLILGEGSLRRRLERQARNLGLAQDVIFGGFVANVRPLLQRSAGFALSSMHEALPLVLIEALDAGVPVASFDCPVGPREILDQGRLGRLIAQRDVEGLARAMTDMVEGRLSARSPAAVAQHLARFAPDLIAREYVAFVEDCLQADVPA